MTGPGRSEVAAPALSVVVATRDRAWLLESCLEALTLSVASGDEIIVVDSHSRGPETAAVARAHGVRLVRCDEAGASLARNAGWRAAAHGVVAFIDDDVHVGPGWAGALRRAFRDHPDAAFVTGRLGLKSEDAGTEWPVAFFDGAEPLPIGADVAANFGHGANFSVRREALELVGGYNEALGPGARFHAAEDLELMDRLLALGLTGRYEPAAEATHEQYRTRSDLVRLEWCYGIGQGARLVLLRGLDRKRFTPVFRYVAVDGGLRALMRCIKEGYEYAACLVAARLAGMGVGALGVIGANTAARVARRRAPTKPTRGRPSVARTMPEDDSKGKPAVKSWSMGDVAVTIQLPRPIVAKMQMLRRRTGGSAPFTPTLEFVERLPELRAQKHDLEECVGFWSSSDFVDMRPQIEVSDGASELEKRVAAHTWYHTIDLPGGVTTRGEYDHRPLVPRYGLPADLSGKRALDIATFDGFWAFQLEARGAEVTAIDIPRFSELDHPAGVRDLVQRKGLDSETGAGFALAAEALGSGVVRITKNVYDLDPSEIGQFDFVHMADILVHLREPLRALERVRSVTAGSALIVDTIDPNMQAMGSRHSLQYFGGWRNVTWWGTSVHTLAQLILDAGFSAVELLGIYRLDLAFERGPWRAIFRATP